MGQIGRLQRLHNFYHDILFFLFFPAPMPCMYGRMQRSRKDSQADASTRGKNDAHQADCCLSAGPDIYRITGLSIFSAQCKHREQEGRVESPAHAARAQIHSSSPSHCCTSNLVAKPNTKHNHPRLTASNSPYPLMFDYRLLLP